MQLMKIIRCRCGATSIEYALIASLIAIAAIAGMQSLGTKVEGTFSNVSNKI